MIDGHHLDGIDADLSVSFHHAGSLRHKLIRDADRFAAVRDAVTRFPLADERFEFLKSRQRRAGRRDWFFRDLCGGRDMTMMSVVMVLGHYDSRPDLTK